MRRKIPPFAKKIGELQKALGVKTQAEFAEMLKVSQPTMSAWLKGDKQRPPSAEAYFRLSTLAHDPDEKIWFLQKAGLDEQTILAAARKLWKDSMKDAGPLIEKRDVILVRRFRETAQRREEAGPRVPLPAEFIPNPLATICLSVDEKSTAIANSPKGLFILDTSIEGTEDLRPLWGRVVMLRYMPDDIDPFLENGIFAGRLWLQEHAYHPRQPDLAGVTGELHLLTGAKGLEILHLGAYVEPEGMRGVAYEDREGRSRRMDEIRERALSKLRLDKGIKILGKVIGRLTGHLEASGKGEKS